MHVPVLAEEAIKLLDPRPNRNFIDCTLGDGGHALAILKRTAPEGKLLGIDADAEAIRAAKLQLQNTEQYSRLITINGNFRNLTALAKTNNFGPIHGILLDLGFSSSTLERGRGFSFAKDEPLDMRFDTGRGFMAAEIINGWNQAQLAELLQEYGEERLARQIADRIVAERKKKAIVTSGRLAEVVVEVYREKLGIRHPERLPAQAGSEVPALSLSKGSRTNARDTHAREILRGVKPGTEQRFGAVAQNYSAGTRVPWIGGIHPATRTFQALRVAVNDELGAIQEVLPQAVEILETGGRLAVIAFHSLEDRIVKHFFKESADAKIRILTKKPIVPGKVEIEKNPKARSGKLRVVEKI